MALNPQEYGYIVPATVQIENRNGKPLTGGHVEFYITGTASGGSKGTQYITFNNFDGSTNPFRIPIDMDGRITAIGTYATRYDMYIYDSYDNMVCSRLNISAIGSGSGSGGGSSWDPANVQIDSPDNSLGVSVEIEGDVKKFHLTVNTQDRPISRAEFVSNTLDGPDWIDNAWKWAEVGEGKGNKISWIQDGPNPNLGNIYAAAGAYHYDITIEVVWEGTPNTEYCNLQWGGFSTDDRDGWIPFDLSYNHAEVWHLSHVFEVIEGYEDRPINAFISSYGVAPAGLKATITGCSIYSLDDSKTIITNDPSQPTPVEIDPSVLVTASTTRYSNGVFTLSPATLVTGDHIRVTDHELKVDKGYYHYDAIIRIDNLLARPSSQQVSVYSPVAEEKVDVDLSDTSKIECVVLSGDFRSTTDDRTFPFQVYGLDSDMAATITSLSVHLIPGTGGVVTPIRIGSSDGSISHNHTTVGGVEVYDLKLNTDLSVYAKIADLAEVAFSGDYSDLSNPPDLSVFAQTASLASVAFSGNYSDLSGTPIIPEGLPDYSQASEGDVLSINGNGDPSWNAPAPSGLQEVAHDTTLNGKGTNAEPLSVRMEAIEMQLTDDILNAVNTLKSRIVYSMGLSCVDKAYNHQGNKNTNGVFAKGTLFNPPMDFDLTDETRIVFATNQRAGGDSGRLYFAVYQYDAASKTVSWIANTDNCFDFVKDTGYQAGFHFALLNHKKDGVSKLSSGKLYYLVMFTDDTNFCIAGNAYTAAINTFNGGTNLGLGAYADNLGGGSGYVISDGTDIETYIPTINWDGEYLNRVFVAITNVTEAPFPDLGNVLPTNTDLASTLPGYTPSSTNSVFMQVTPLSNCDVKGIEWIDGMASNANWSHNHYIYTDDFSTNLTSGIGITVTNTEVGAQLPGAYRHKIVFASTVHLSANTNYKILCECFESGSSTLYSWGNPKNVIEVSRDGMDPSLSTPSTYPNIIGKYLKITCTKNGVDTDYVI